MPEGESPGGAGPGDTREGGDPSTSDLVVLGLLASLAAGVSLGALSLAPPEPHLRTYFLEVLAAPLGPSLPLLEVPVRAIVAPWFHGDVAHLLGNLVGMILLGVAARGRGSPGALAWVVFLGAMPGMALHTLTGQASLGMSGGVHALAGTLLRVGRGGWASPGRLLGLAYLALGLVGGVGAPTTDNLGHLVGASIGVLFGPWILRAGRGGPGLVLVWVLPALVALSGHEAALRATRRARPGLEAIRLGRDLVTASVEAQRARHEALEALLARARSGASVSAEGEALVAALGVPASREEVAGELRELLEALPDIPARGEYRRRIGGVLPVPPPEPFTSLPLPEVREEHEASWKALLAYLERRDEALVDGARALRELRRDLRRIR